MSDRTKEQPTWEDPVGDVKAWIGKVADEPITTGTRAVAMVPPSIVAMMKEHQDELDEVARRYGFSGVTIKGYDA